MPTIGVNNVHEGYNRKMQAVKLADVFGVEKLWRGVYEKCRQNGDFATKKRTSNMHSIL